jgi:pentatricopeptide repeat protein
LNGLCKQRRLFDAEEIFSEMEERGIPPDLCTFTTLIHGYCSEGNVEIRESIAIIRHVVAPASEARCCDVQ